MFLDQQRRVQFSCDIGGREQGAERASPARESSRRLVQTGSMERPPTTSQLGETLRSKDQALPELEALGYQVTLEPLSAG